jgi:hypothetical protein
MQHDLWWSKVRRSFATFESYMTAIIAVPAIALGLGIIWVSWGDRFGLGMGMFIVAGGVWMSWETFRAALTQRRE